MVCVGPGPKGYMVMAIADGDDKGQAMLYNIKTNTLTRLGKSPLKAVSASGNRIVYMQNNDGSDNIYVANLQVETVKTK